MNPYSVKVPSTTSGDLFPVPHDRAFTRSLPNHNLGVLLSRRGSLVHAIASATAPLGELLEINASTTAAEADDFTALLCEEDQLYGRASWPALNTGLIDPYRVKWGTQELRHSGLRLQRPCLLCDAGAISHHDACNTTPVQRSSSRNLPNN